jgi:hypothetical protein
MTRKVGYNDIDDGWVVRYRARTVIGGKKIRWMAWILALIKRRFMDPEGHVSCG